MLNPILFHIQSQPLRFYPILSWHPILTYPVIPSIVVFFPVLYYASLPGSFLLTSHFQYDRNTSSIHLEFSPHLTCFFFVSFLFVLFSYCCSSLSDLSSNLMCHAKIKFEHVAVLSIHITCLIGLLHELTSIKFCIYKKNLKSPD